MKNEDFELKFENCETFCYQNNFVINVTVNCKISYWCLKLKLGKINKIADKLTVCRKTVEKANGFLSIYEMISYLENRTIIMNYSVKKYLTKNLIICYKI